MSTLAEWSYTQTLTVWPRASGDKYGAPTFGTPYTITGSWIEGGEVQTDADGNEFVPMSRYFFQFAYGSASIPARGEYIKVGSHTGTANPITAGAELVRKVTGFDMVMFGASETPDWIVYT